MGAARGWTSAFQTRSEPATLGGMSSNIKWERYADTLQILDPDVDAAEEAIGFKFPDDYRELLLDHQGQIPGDDGATAVPVAEHHFSQRVGMIIPIRTRGRRKLVKLYKKSTAFGYPKNLLPFADGGLQPHFALDFITPSSPTVVYVNPEAADMEDGGAEWARGVNPLVRFYGAHGAPFEFGGANYFTFHIANSISEFLAKFEVPI